MLYPFFIFMNPLIKMSLSLDLSDKYLISQKPTHIFRKSTGRRIKRTKTIFYFTMNRRTLYLMFRYVLHKMLKGNIILNQTAIIRVFYL